jgi:hypothetical protein
LYVVRRQGRVFYVDRICKASGLQTVSGSLQWQAALEVGWDFVSHHRARGEEADLAVRIGAAQQLSLDLGLEFDSFSQALAQALELHTVSCVAVYVGTTPGVVRRWIARQLVPHGDVSVTEATVEELIDEFGELAEVDACPCSDVLLRQAWLRSFQQDIAPHLR